MNVWLHACKDVFDFNNNNNYYIFFFSFFLLRHQAEEHGSQSDKTTSQLQWQLDQLQGESH